MDALEQEHFHSEDPTDHLADEEASNPHHPWSYISQWFLQEYFVSASKNTFGIEDVRFFSLSLNFQIQESVVPSPAEKRDQNERMISSNPPTIPYH